MKKVFLISLLVILATAQADWKRALPGWKYEFPRDHYSHDDFKTEWWYFTGIAHSADGSRFGYELTFFRQGIRPPGSREASPSRFVRDHFQFAHFAITDIGEKKFHAAQKASRGAFGEAGVGKAPEKKLVWMDDWQLTLNEDGSYAISAEETDFAIELELHPSKPLVYNGENGASQKAAGAGNASHYYSATRLTTKGKLRIGETTSEVSGSSWFDREWASNQLGDGQVGWDWFSIQLDDGTELMLYQMRLANGQADPVSSGTFVAKNGDALHLKSADYQLAAEKASIWKSPKSGGGYPLGWEIAVPSLGLELTVTTPMDDQELPFVPLTYWEGIIDVTGSKNGKPIRGEGYMELTGYGRELNFLRE